MPGADARVMYLVLRSDLMKVLKWPLGAVIAQGAHAATACIWSYKEDADVIEYMRDMNHMRKVALQVEDELELKSIEKVLTDNNIDYRLWVEDDMPVCIAVKPQPRNVVHKHLRHLRLYA